MSDRPTILDGVDPTHLGLPEKFTSFRQIQREIADYAHYGPDGGGTNRFVLIGAPTGSGKSLSSEAIGKMFGEDARYVTLTATKTLQDQRQEDFDYLCDIRGKSNYTCTSIELPVKSKTGFTRYVKANCKLGGEYGCRNEGKPGQCPYSTKIEEANHEPALNTNYQLWMNIRGMNPLALEKGGRIHALICDEAHKIPEEISRFLETYISFEDLYRLAFNSPEERASAPWTAASVMHGPVNERWFSFLSGVAATVNGKLDNLLRKAAWEIALDRAKGDEQHASMIVDSVKKGECYYHAKDRYDDYRALERLARDVGKVILHGGDDNWLWELKPKGLKFSIVWPWRYAEKYLFTGIPKVFLLSGTARPKLASLLGIRQGEMDFKEWPRQFPAANGMVYYVPTVKMHRHMSGDDTKLMVAKVDEMLDLWKGYKGIIHTASYDRAELLKSLSRYGKYMLLNERGSGSEGANDKAEEFRAKVLQPGEVCVLVSPSYTTGWDFPLDAWEEESFQIIIKTPFPDYSSPVVKARDESDPEYQAYDIVQNLVQACGRRNRTERDVCTTVILDDAVKRFMGSARKHGPQYFRIYIRQDLPRPKKDRRQAAQ